MSSSSYNIVFAPRTEDQLNCIPKDIRKLIIDRIEKLHVEPRPVGVEPLQGSEKRLFRIRQGDYRIVYSIDDSKLLILIVRVRQLHKSVNEKLILFPNTEAGSRRDAEGCLIHEELVVFLDDQPNQRS